MALSWGQTPNNCTTLVTKQLGDNYIQNVHLGRYKWIGGRKFSFTAKRKWSCKTWFATIIWWYTSPNEYFEYGYPYFNVYKLFLATKLHQRTPTLHNLCSAKESISSNLQIQVPLALFNC